ncbi:hypothetical protein HAY47_004725 [Salmonella enterica]|nr:hypothetical protein [Salmonella enterica]ECI4153531.1 hypothetical protein [Salmonella enterica subsp. salamae]HCM1853061.1 hypothetical protein [Salmonella enterica subsp. salamae serovar 42:z29:-]EAU0241998.1 hypothetical protein [Salmonella enterica]EAX3604328.1 hypothetical protein [Salmonella enterica]
MSQIDFTLHDLPMLLTRNKSKQWRELILIRSTVLVSFLKDNELLINIEPFDNDGNIKESLIIKMSNVTADGLELFKKTIPGWHQFLDKGGKIENISRLEKGLAKIREAKI